MNPVNLHRCWRTSYKPQGQKLDKKTLFGHENYTFSEHSCCCGCWLDEACLMDSGEDWHGLTTLPAGGIHLFEKNVAMLWVLLPLFSANWEYTTWTKMAREGASSSITLYTRQWEEEIPLLSTAVWNYKKIRTSGTCCYSTFWEQGESNIINGLYALLSKG